MKYILTLEAYYKKRGLIGKAVDWVKGRKDFNDIIEGKERRRGDWRKTYSFDKKTFKIEETFTDEDEGISRVINWKEKNPDKFLIFGLVHYENATYNRFQLIKFELLIKDLLEVSDNRLEILGVEVNRNYEYEEFQVVVTFREDGFEKGDGMPDDIYDDYVNMIKSGLKKKREKYVEEYNILQRQKTTQKMKYRSIRLYDVTTGYQSRYDDERGLITIIIDPRM
jgi:hypothetical protein